MVIFNSYVKLPEGISPADENPNPGTYPAIHGWTCREKMGTRTVHSRFKGSPGLWDIMAKRPPSRAMGTDRTRPGHAGQNESMEKHGKSIYK